ncbi:hypothetical protein FKP32DRAFT_1614234 [Trametes sanguinea]|nr:hypothetical protein FKP32DRAFT_1614234 [Trametes sanguinea]
MVSISVQIYGQKLEDGSTNPYAPFVSEIDWDVANWATRRGPSSKAFSELLAVKGVVEKLGLSYKNSKELNSIIDKKLPGSRPRFVLECIAALWGNPEHVRYLCFAPQRHYVDADKTLRLYHDLHTGKWWWSVQKTLEAENPGATVVPIIVSSDKTQVTLFRNKSAYPVYLTIGNLPKAIRQKPGRQGQILLAYLPTSRLEHISNKAARRRTIANLFHACMSHILAPLRSAGAEGVVMVSGDGVARRCHPILAAYVGDYPEQCLVTCSYSGDCPICQCPHMELGVFPSPYAPRDFEASRLAAKSLGSPDFDRACDAANIKPVQHPFWEDLPYLDIFQSITVDVLHQVYQGVFKHLVSWLKLAYGAAELDARVARLPPNHAIRVFYKGISNLSRVSGAEHRQISRFLLGAIADVDVPGGRPASDQLTRMTRALLDFMNMAQYPVHSTKTLEALDSALAACIKLFGTTDNYSTETTERLHIDFAKEAYRATNHKDEYPQMTRWLERREKMMHHSHYLVRWQPPDLTCALHVKMTRHPTRKAVPLAEITSSSGYGAQFFVPALARFVVAWRHPDFSARLVEYHAEDFIVPFHALPVFHRVKFWNESVYGNQTIDSVHVRPAVVDASGHLEVRSRFDTALIRIRNSSSAARHMRVAQVRVVFTLTDAVLDYLFPALPAHQRPPRHLAYVEWFSKFSAAPDRNTRMYKVSRTLQGDQRLASILPVNLIERSVHLIPRHSGPIPRQWTSDNVLDECSTFYLNPYKDMHTYFNLY